MEDNIFPKDKLEKDLVYLKANSHLIREEYLEYGDNGLTEENMKVLDRKEEKATESNFSNDIYGVENPEAFNHSYKSMHKMLSNIAVIIAGVIGVTIVVMTLTPIIIKMFR